MAETAMSVADRVVPALMANQQDVVQSYSGGGPVLTVSSFEVSRRDSDQTHRDIQHFMSFKIYFRM